MGKMIVVKMHKTKIIKLKYYMNGTVYHIILKKQLPNINSKITAENLVSPLSLRNSYTPLSFLSFALKNNSQYEFHDTFVNIII
jgi:hypothetical protein